MNSIGWGLGAYWWLFAALFLVAASVVFIAAMNLRDVERGVK